ncbi:MAG: phospholipase D family protein [Deltaproteobacteria bacterium]|nr:phospholipase D family protein [Deltaproteobacteria bacterium]
MRKALTIIWVIVALGGCATFPKNFQQIPSTAYRFPERTELGRLFPSPHKQDSQKSGFLLLNGGRRAILARLALADMAEKTLDMQYYIWEDDASGWLLLERAVRAAQRGVRVRILVDDFTLSGRDFKVASALNAHFPNMEFRVYNPFSRRYRVRIMRAFELVRNFSRLNHRMHNKKFAVDNQVAIVGGRNIGDNYFGTHPKLNYRDFDLFMAGPVAAGVSASFDSYWNSKWAVPLEAFREIKPSGKDFDRAKKRLKKKISKFEKEYPYPLDVTRQDILKRLREIRDDLTWANAEVLYDTPGKGKTEEEPSSIAERLGKLARGAQRDLLIENPYFLPSQLMLKNLGKIAQRGVNVRILTNSLAATDVTIVQAAFEKYRVPLLSRGIQLYELRPDAESKRLHADKSVQSSKLSLHAKVVVFDTEKVFVGTLNLDPRSIDLNTEVGILVHSPALARKITKDLEVDFQAQNSWKVELETIPVQNTNEVETYVVWIAEKDGKEKRYYREPAGFWLKVKAAVLSLLPVEDQL